MVESSDRVAIEDEDRIIPEVLLPSQLTARPPATPERALLSTVLLDALECFQKYYGATAGPHRQLFDDAEQWIFGLPGDAPLSFEETCELLSLDPRSLRRVLCQWCERQPVRTFADDDTTVAIAHRASR